MVALVLLSICATQSAPPALERAAVTLRKTGAKVEVSNVEDPEWEIWADHNGPLGKGALKPFHDVRRLAALRLMTDDLTDAHIADIRDNPDLKLLVVISKQLTDACTVPISKMTELRKLDLNKGTWTAKGLRRLTSLKKLERFYLYNAKIADDQLSPLEQFKWLKILDLPSTVSDRVLNRLKKALPRVQVSRGV